MPFMSFARSPRQPPRARRPERRSLVAAALAVAPALALAAAFAASQPAALAAGRATSRGRHEAAASGAGAAGLAPAASAAPAEAGRSSAPQLVMFTSDDAYPRERWIYGQSPRPIGAAGAVSALIEAKRAEVDGRWAGCGAAAARARAMAKALVPWIDALELRCALEAAAEGDRGASGSLVRALDGVDRRAEELAQGPQAQALRQSYAQAALVAFDALAKADRGRAWLAFDRLERARAWLDDKQKARAFRVAGELSFIQQRPEAARAFFRRSLDAIADQPDVRARLQGLEATLLRPGSGNKGEGGDSGAVAGSAAAAGKPASDARLETAERENEIVDRATNALKRGDLVPAADDLISLLRDFPGGSRAKWAADRMQEIYLSIAEREDGGRAQVRAQVAKRMLEADGDRRVDWSRNLFARGFYDDAFALAKSAAEDARGSAREGRALEAVMAAAMAMEKWADAREAAQGLIERHAGTTGGRDAFFRSAQAAYRMRDYGAATAQLERLLAIPQSDSLELGARHLLWRALQKAASPRASEARDALIARFPFSYYGLRALADRDGAIDAAAWERQALALAGAAPKGALASGAAPPPAAGAARAKIKVVEEEWFSGASRAAFERAALLLRAGWLEEAQAEIRELPAPIGPRAKALRARLHAAALDYQVASKLVAEAWDADPSLRREPFLRVGFPLEFLPSIEKETKARGLEKWLALSLIKQESAFNPRAQSSSNARGLMQMIPPTAREIAEDLGIRGFEFPRDLEQPPLNVRMGSYYLAKVLRKYQGNVPLALASYNAGPGRMDRWLKFRPSLAGLAQSRSSSADDELWFDELPWSETCYYVKAILRNLLIYRALDQGRVEIGDAAWAAPRPEPRPGPRPTPSETARNSR